MPPRSYTYLVYGECFLPTDEATEQAEILENYMKKFEKNTTGIRAAIKSVCNRAGTLQKDVQVIAVACLEHTKEHGDWTLGAELIEGISASKGVKSSKLTMWFEAFMGASYTKNDAGAFVFVYDEDKNHESILIDAAQEVNWFDFKADKGETSVDVSKEITKLIKRMDEADVVKVSFQEARELVSKLSEAINTLEIESQERDTEEQQAAA